MSVFSDRIKQLRKDRKENLKTVSDVIGIEQQSLGRYERDERKPDIEIAGRLADYYGVSVDYLLGRTDVQTPDTEIKAVCEYTGLSESAINFLFKLKEKSEYRAYSDLLSVIITNPKFEYILGLIEKCIVSDNQPNKSLDSFSIVEFSDRQLAAFALNQFIPEWLEKISEDFLSSYLSSEFKVNNQIFERLKTKAIEQYNNGEITAEEKYDRMQSIETDFKKKQKELIEKYERILKGE